MPDSNGVDQHDPDQRTTTIVLAEFSGLRSEIATRINLLATMIIANLTILGVVFGIALSRSGNTNVLLVLPFVTPSLGLMYINQQRNLIYLGDYIGECIRRQLHIDDAEVFGWEPYIRKRQFSLWLSAPYLVAVFVQFLVPPIAVLIYAQSIHTQALVSTSQRVLWWVGAMLTIGSTSYAVGYLIYAFRHSSGSPQSDYL
jgi:hypothetical protein